MGHTMPMWFSHGGPTFPFLQSQGSKEEVRINQTSLALSLGTCIWAAGPTAPNQDLRTTQTFSLSGPLNFSDLILYVYYCT